jgi:ion channel-forming bestrophin family protein
MHAGKRFHPLEMIIWTRRELYKHLMIATLVTLLYFFGAKFIAISWVPITLLGTSVALIVGFKNNATYARLWEARQIYGSIINNSRAFAVMVRDFYGHEQKDEVHTVFLRHFAWLTALRYQLRTPKVWENLSDIENIEYLNKYKIPERETPLKDALDIYLSNDEFKNLSSKSNLATQIMAIQSKHINGVYNKNIINDFKLMQLQSCITAFYDNQGRAERIKNFPYPRNLSSIASILLKVFVLMVPFGLLNDFNKLGSDTILEGYSIWLNIPFSVLLCWVFTSLDKVGDSSSNPFEGGANDIPITNISRTIEIDMLEMIEEKNIPKPILAMNDILL